jgi:hypothetical protein
MSETSTKKRRGVLVITAVLALPAFGGGVWLGNASVKALPEQRPLVVDEGAEPAADDALITELGACQRKLARRKKNRTSPSTMDGGPTETEVDAGSEPRIVEVEKEIKTCKRSAMLHGAELCRSVRLYLDALLGLPKNDVLCVQRVRVADYIEDDFEKCAAFKVAPSAADLEGYTQEERQTILDAVEVAKSLDEEKLADLLNGVHQGCYGAPRKDSP